MSRAKIGSQGVASVVSLCETALGCSILVELDNDLYHFWLGVWTFDSNGSNSTNIVR